MPSTESTWRAVGAAGVLLTYLYALVVSAQILLGTLVAALWYLLAWTVRRVGPREMLARTGRRRAAAVGVVALAAGAYGAAGLGDPLVGALFALLVVALGWLTAPDGPLVRLVRWVLDARDDLRAVREAVERGPGDDHAAADD
jgi:hypothetical protein